ncbi:hypothetical protein T265_14372, partial [Opisthorchis viverrini]
MGATRRGSRDRMGATIEHSVMNKSYNEHLDRLHPTGLR